MSEPGSSPADQPRAVASAIPAGVAASAVILAVIYASISLLSLRFAWGSPVETRPVCTFLALMTAAFAVHLVALRTAIRRRLSESAGRWILLAGLGFRLILLPSHPVQEIDIYRYMWDGLVVSQGVSPYRFSPQQVLEFEGTPANEDLRRLVERRDSADGIRETLSRVHFRHLTTIYPPVSQAVFAAAAVLTPQSATSRTRLLITRAVIVLFDALAMQGMLRLLRVFRRPAAWLIVYAWSPLVLKEFANSGHLDAIAVGLSTWAIVWWLKAVQSQNIVPLLLAAATLGLSVAAKLYPVVFLPVIAGSVIGRFPLKSSLAAALLFSAVTFTSLRPMLHSEPPDPTQLSRRSPPSVTSPPLPETASTSNQESGDGLTAFMSSWRMNDLIFSGLMENLVPQSRAWYSVIPMKLRETLRSPVMQRTGVSEYTAAFMISRAVMAVIHVTITLSLMVLAWRCPVRRLPNLAFLSVAWFFLLLPTLNPWYWTWAMPLLPFARLRSWLLLSGCVSIYYLRFWLKYEFGRTTVVGTDYSGPEFFDHVVVWLEYLPFLLILTAEAIRKRGRGGTPRDRPISC
ncbi:MAG: hypothetical protein RIK87_15045 [Fuerstiella sp.]